MGREGSEEGGGERKEERKQRGRWGGKRGEEAESEVGRKDMWLLALHTNLVPTPSPSFLSLAVWSGPPPASHRL